jgi:hypothetical protein
LRHVCSPPAPRESGPRAKWPTTRKPPLRRRANRQLALPIRVKGGSARLAVPDASLDDQQERTAAVLDFDESGCAAQQYRAKTHARISSNSVTRRSRREAPDAAASGHLRYSSSSLATAPLPCAPRAASVSKQQPRQRPPGGRVQVERAGQEMARGRPPEAAAHHRECAKPRTGRFSPRAPGRCPAGRPC